MHRVYHLDRGYHRMEEALNRLGASIERIDDKDLERDASDPVRVASEASPRELVEQDR